MNKISNHLNPYRKKRMIVDDRCIRSRHNEPFGGKKLEEIVINIEVQRNPATVSVVRNISKKGLFRIKKANAAMGINKAEMNMEYVMCFRYGSNDWRQLFFPVYDN